MSKYVDCFKSSGLENAAIIEKAEAQLKDDSETSRLKALQLAREYGTQVQTRLNKLQKELGGKLAAAPDPVTAKQKDTKVDTALIEQIEALKEESKAIGETEFALFDQATRGILTRTPGTGPHSTSSIKIVGFYDASENVVLVPAEVAAVSGADYDIDAKALSMYYIDTKSKRILFPENLTNSSTTEQIIKAHKNNMVRRSIEIMENPFNAVTAQQSVDESMNTLKEFLPERENISHEDLVANWEAHEENHSGKDLISVFANTEKLYTALYEYYRNSDLKTFPIEGVEGNFNEIWPRISALINAGTDTVKNRILGPLKVTKDNSDFISYAVMTGMTFKDLFGKQGLLYVSPKGVANQPELMDYFNALRNRRLYYSESPKPDVPAKFAKFLRGARVMGQFAKSIPNTDKSLPTSLEETISWLQSFSRMMDDAGVENFNLFDYMEKGTVERAKIRAGVSTAINPLEILEGSPLLKAYYTSVKRLHDANFEHIPIYKFLYGATVSAPSSLFNFRVHQVYQATVDAHLRMDKIVSSKDVDLSTVEGRVAHINYVNSELLSTLKNSHEYTYNKFVSNLTREKFETTEGTIESKLVISDLKQMSEQRQAEVQGGFNQLPANIKKDLYYYSLITNGLAETRESFAPLFDDDINAKWSNFLNTKVDDAFGLVTPDKLINNIADAKEEDVPSLAIPFSLATVTPASELPPVTNDEGPAVRSIQLARAAKVSISGITDIADAKDAAFQAILGKPRQSVSTADYKNLEAFLRNHKQFHENTQEYFKPVLNIVTSIINDKKERDTRAKMEKRKKFCNIT